MTEYNLARPSIMVDLRKYRIRIHKNTLSSIGAPDNVLLLINPEDRTLAILRSDCSEPLAHHISRTSLTKRKSFELYSRSLVKNLLDICRNWQDNQTYRLYGKTISNGGGAWFHLDESVLVNQEKL